jgi:hypothetical protein
MMSRRLTLCEVAVREYFYVLLRTEMYALQPDMYEVA